MRQQPISLENALNVYFDKMLKNMNVCLPARVLSFDASRQVATIQPDIRAVIRDDESQEKLFNRFDEKIGVRHEEMPAVEDVPVQYPRAGQFALTLPIAVGDTGLMVFSQRDISRWKKQGSDSKQADLNLFSYSNAFFIPGVVNEINADGSYSANALEMKANSDKISMDGTDITIKPSGGNTKINDAGDFAVLYNELKTVYDKFVADVNTELGKLKGTVGGYNPIATLPIVSDLTPAKDEDLKI